MSSFGKKTRNPGYSAGDSWVICDRCGFAVHGSLARETWDGLTVCPEDWEARHDQDFVRARKEKQVADVIRPEGIDVYVSKICESRTAKAGMAIASCAIAGVDEFVESTVPQGTFNTNTL